MAVDRIGELAAHFFDLHGLRPSEALAEARRLRRLADAKREAELRSGDDRKRQQPCCPECEAWLRRQLERLGKEGG